MIFMTKRKEAQLDRLIAAAKGDVNLVVHALRVCGTNGHIPDEIEVIRWIELNLI